MAIVANTEELNCFKQIRTLSSFVSINSVVLVYSSVLTGLTVAQSRSAATVTMILSSTILTGLALY